ncbi:MAG: tetraacyldisaccharide 4'-kinase [Pyrinomonadaceae bacterium]
MNTSSPFEWIYSKIGDARNTLYDKGALAAHDLGARTISIGNITVGGTGKTPLVAYVAGVLAARGEKVCILTRGYGRANPRRRLLVTDGQDIESDVRLTGDEPQELARRLQGKAIIVADADRVSTGKWAKERFGVTRFVLDDGFQHRRVKRDVDIVCVDATDPFGNGRVLPAGILREQIDGLRRADVIVVTRSDLVEDTRFIVDRIRSTGTDAKVSFASGGTYQIVPLKDFLSGGLGHLSQKIDLSEPNSAYAFCALGNPDNFSRQLRFNSIGLDGFRAFPDHHFYTQDDIRRLHAAAANAGALITTAKDAVKLKNLKFDMPCFVALSTPKIHDREAFDALL